MQSKQLADFKSNVLDYYQHNARHDMAWRKHPTPYHVFVSEVMLQQTQVARVKPKFDLFISNLPNFLTLANAKTSLLLNLWQGLGYNRRALNLQKAAQEVVTNHKSQLPDSYEELNRLPGIGAATTGAILAYAYNQPIVFIETNIRRAVIHHFFADQQDISDTQIIPILIDCLALTKNYREWYWALTDYGNHLRNININPNRKSKHYIKQSVFEGSTRQLRGTIIRYLLTNDVVDKSSLAKLATNNNQTEQLDKVIQDLVNEKFITTTKQGYKIV